MYTRKSGYSSFVLLLGNLRNVKALNSLPAGCLGEWDRRKKEGGRKFTIANYPLRPQLRSLSLLMAAWLRAA